MEYDLGEYALKRLPEPEPVENGCPSVVVHPDRCVAARGVEGCLKCVDACSAGCLSEKDKGLVFDTKKCVGCGACAAVCPTCAIEATSPTDGELEWRFEKACRDAQLTIVCHPRAEQLRTIMDHESVVEVVCLGRIEESILVGAVSKGVRKINLVHADCDGCRQNGGFRCAKVAVKSANNLLRLWRKHDAIRISNRAPSYIFHSRDRQSCDLVLASGPATGCIGNGPVRGCGPVMSPDFAAGEAANRTGGLPNTVPSRRRNLLDGFAALGAPSYESAVSRLWASLEIDGSRCDGCRKCAAICPTGALSCSEQESGFFGVVHRASKCVNCGTCSGACPNGAIATKPKAKIADLLCGSVRMYEMKRTAMAYYA